MYKEGRVDVILKNEDANLQYWSKDLEEVFDDLGDFIRHHVTYQRPRLEVLDDYYKGHNTGIYSRRGRTNPNKADNRIAHPFAKYISQFVQGYMTGVPVKVGADDETLKEVVTQVGEDSEVDMLNSELVLDLSKYGRAYELVFFKEGRGDKAVLLDVENTFVVYDATVTSEELCGVHYRLTEDKGIFGRLGANVGVEVTIYTSDYVYVLQSTSLNGFEVVIDEERSRPHSYSEVPIIEYKVDRQRQGDYESVIKQIDSYDSRVSDLTNYTTDFNDATLMFKGDTGGIDWDKVSEGLSDGTILEVDSGIDASGNPAQIDVGYLVRDSASISNTADLDRIKYNIHQLTHIPDMSDESFGNNVSGVSLKYKFSGLAQLVSTKKRALERGFNKRYRMITKSKNFTNEYTGVKFSKLTYKWTDNLPEDVEGEMKAFKDSGGELSQETLLSTLSFVPNVEDEKKKLLAEKIGVTVEEINKLTPEQLRSVMGIVSGNTLVNVQGTPEEGVQVKTQTGEGSNPQNSEGVNKLNRLIEGEEVLV